MIEAIEQVMLNNRYFAPLKLLYKEVWNYKDKSKLKGLIPDYTIQERVQRDKRFKKIGLGVYALTDYVENLEINKRKFQQQKPEIREHAKIQGMLLGY